jgi:transglutaminase-like putative cysteine protease
LVVAFLFFFLIPRHPAIWRRAQKFEDRAVQSTVGFSRNLSLGDIGQILESTKKVMEVQLVHPQTGEVLDIEQYAQDLGHEEPLFRGMTAVEYRNGQWRTWRSKEPSRGDEFFLPRPNRRSSRFVEQRIRLEAIDSELLFAMPPAFAAEVEGVEDAVLLDRLNDVLKRPDRRADKSSADYRILSPRLPDRPGTIPLRSTQLQFERMRPEFVKVPPELAALERLAAEKAGANDAPRPTDLEMAHRLEAFLKTSGEFGYTLNANVDDPQIDPLEDFLFNRKQGHCEYFASALVMMLRSVGIPARLASGFKGGTYHEATGRLIVEERHAHAWVEAFIDRSWVILDPTPPGRAESVASVAGSQGTLTDLRVFFQDFWNRFIVNLNVSEQRKLLEPFKRLANDALAWLRDSRARLTSFINGLRQQLQSPEHWISWQGGLVTFVLLSAVSGLVWMGRVLSRVFVKLRTQYFDPDGLARTVAFYEHFRRICSKAGWTRTASQTPKEFAVEVRQKLDESFPHLDGRDFPLFVTEAYYEVRYGGKQLGPNLHDQLEQELTRFEALFHPSA